jgi:hypothetical protein
MMFIAAAYESTMMLLLTEQDVNDMRSGRTKHVDKTATKGQKFDKVVISVVKDHEAAKDILRQAGHGKLLEGIAPSVPEPPMVRCQGCGADMPAPELLAGHCIICWKEKADHYRREWLAAQAPP